MFEMSKYLISSAHILLFTLPVDCNVTSGVSSTMNSSDQGKQECLYLQDNVWRKTYLTEHAYRNLVALICVNSVTRIPTILLNALAIFAVTKNRSLQSNSNILLACLAGSDLFAGMVGLTFTVAVNVKRAFSIEPFCALESAHFITLYGPTYVSLGHLVLISVDRYIAIKEALKYPVIVTKQQIKKGAIAPWAIGVLSGNSGNCLSCYCRRSCQNVLSVLDSRICLSFCDRVGLHFWYLFLLHVYFLRNTATEKAAAIRAVNPGRRKKE